jgi:hypothetical protein
MRTAIILALGLLLTAGPALAANELIVTEIMYNSIESTDVEWIEVYNNSGTTLDLTGWYILDNSLAHEKAYLSGTMAPGAVMVLAGTQSLFTAKYPGVTNYFPVFFQELTPTNWNLGNSGDEVQIFDAASVKVFDVVFTDTAPWPTAPDGNGPSLQLISNGCADLSAAACWTAGAVEGTPGVFEGAVPTLPSTWGMVKSIYR